MGLGDRNFRVAATGAVGVRPVPFPQNDGGYFVPKPFEIFVRNLLNAWQMDDCVFKRYEPLNCMNGIERTSSKCSRTPTW
jgi:hypothetical protein